MSYFSIHIWRMSVRGMCYVIWNHRHLSATGGIHEEKATISLLDDAGWTGSTHASF